VGLGNEVKRHFLNHSSIKLPLKPFLFFQFPSFWLGIHHHQRSG